MNKSDHVYISEVEVYDDIIFTHYKAWDWQDHMLRCFEMVINQLMSKVDPVSGLDYYVCKSLIEEIVVDAIIGLKKITSSISHNVTFPNEFKVAAYLGYWWLRHKPVTILCPEKSLDDVQILGNYADENAKQLERQKLIWRLKHVNELVAVQLVATRIFNFNNVLCDESRCRKIKTQGSNFCFSNFDDMRVTILQKLTYYFAYRAIAPKIIEHILEGYTFHPAWGLTGKHWYEQVGEPEGAL